MARKRKKLGEILTDWNVVTEEAVQQALGIAKGTSKRIGEALVEAGFCSDEDVAKALADQHDMEYIDLSEQGSDSVDMTLVPDDVVRKHLVLPMSKRNGRLKVVIHDPLDLELLDLLRFRLNCEIDTAVAPKSEIKAFIDRARGGGGSGGAAGGKDMFASEERMASTPLHRFASVAITSSGGSRSRLSLFHWT